MAQRTGRPPREDEEIDELVWPFIERLQDPHTGKLPPQRAVAAAVREKGPISAAHVQNSMARWTQRQPPRVSLPAEPLPPAFVQTMAELLETDRREQRQELEARTTELAAANEDLAREDLQHQAQIAALQAQLEERDRDHATLSGQLAEIAAARDKLAEELKVERDTLEQLRTKLVMADLRVQELDTLRTDHGKLQRDFQTEREARIQAERNLSGERATKEALTKQVTDLESREKTAVADARALQKRVSELTDHLQTVESQRAQAVGEASAAQGALKQLTTELDHQRADLVRGQSEKADAVRAAGVAEGARASGERRIQELETVLTQCQQERERSSAENTRLRAQLGAAGSGASSAGSPREQTPASDRR